MTLHLAPGPRSLPLHGSAPPSGPKVQETLVENVRRRAQRPIQRLISPPISSVSALQRSVAHPSLFSCFGGRLSRPPSHSAAMCACSPLVQISLGGFWPLPAPSQFETKAATELSSIGGFSLSPTSLMIGIYPPGTQR